MKKFVIASVGKNAGKTSLIVGLAKGLKRPFGYLKPFGDRLVYREKKLWDYDADLIMNVFGMRKDPEDLTIGFEHAKLRYMYDGEGRKKRLQEMVSQAQGEILFVEGESISGTAFPLASIPSRLQRISAPNWCF